ncbi:MrcB family domain-containing protein [Pleomorphomonas sp. JP5]|uniref:MrcB family domain-containing protein n=1 Tax=Pleomorphomonas sp. JP5 TaxID=2942998 RepID=UPI00204484BF|nr:DUF3578 domain-containing protein [Pleomorphomonas sp. JP5]MCM5558495.1 DUF3578 domain-containing protein [Pleomorphomonas sp. JP5]
MRNEFEQFIQNFPDPPVIGNGSFKITPLRNTVLPNLRTLFRGIVHAKENLTFDLSIGDRDWTYTPWVAILDKRITKSVQRQYYIVYLLSKGKDRLYLTLAQGCNDLRKSAGMRVARRELASRASVMRGRVERHASRLAPVEMDLNTNGWRAKLYETGCIVAREYDAHHLPTDREMIEDLEEALRLYKHLVSEGGWTTDGDILQEAEEAGLADKSLKEAKRYKEHRAIERSPDHSRKVKAAQGTRCRCCGFEMSEVYGAIAKEMCDAHHLVPLSDLKNGQTVLLDPRKDFVVLCPSCHRAIHRQKNVADLGQLRESLMPGKLGYLAETNVKKLSWRGSSK